MPNAYNQEPSAYLPGFTETYLEPEDYDQLELDIPDDRLLKMLVDSLDADVDYWNQEPFKLQDTDIENVKFFLGDQFASSKMQIGREITDIDNRLFSSVRAILSYATGSLAVPEVTPSRGDEQYVKMARSLQNALYQHSLDEKVAEKTRAAVENLIIRKRGFLKVRYDPNLGPFGDVVTEVVNPEDMIIDRHAAYMKNPNKMTQRLHMTIDEAVSRWPNKKTQIYATYGIKQGRYTQTAKMIHPFECWFTYNDSDNIPREGVCWFIKEGNLILDKMANPNWLYLGNDKKDKDKNLLQFPPKPYAWFNYLNLGHSFIDETCLFEQAKPMQEGLNRRRRQWNDNIDYANGRWVGSKQAMSEEDGQKVVNKGARTILLVDAEDVGKAFTNVSADALPPQVYESIEDYRNEIDTIMGTPSIFRGDDPSNQDTLGRDQMVKQQAGMLQDDLVRAVQNGMEIYYALKLQMFLVYYTDDYWFQVKGGDGKYDFIMLNGDNIDANVKVGVKIDSTLPLDKASQRATAMALAKLGLNDPLTMYEDLGMPDPDIRTERLLRSRIDSYTYMQSVEQGMDNNNAEVDIMLVIDGKDPEERDIYDEGYINYVNYYFTTNRFANLPQKSRQALVQFLQAVQIKAQKTATLQGSMLNDAGIINRPPVFPLPKRTENIRLNANLGPQDSHQIAEGEGQMFQPVQAAENAQSPQTAGTQNQAGQQQPAPSANTLPQQ